MKEITEGLAKINIFDSDKISKDMEVFYNPKMKLNRDVTILLLNSVENENMKLADIMAGTGVRSIRLLKELKEGKIKEIHINDGDEASVELIKKNLESNNLLENEQIIVTNKECSKMMLSNSGFDYIDVDPFGSPNPYLDAACKKISRNGIMAITATDTAALSGSNQKAGIRKYGAKPRNNFLMHETGVRILIRKVQLVAAQYEKALIPVLSYSREHYYRIFFRNEKGKKKVDEMLKQQKYLLICTNCLNFFTSEKNCGTCCKKEMDFIGPMYCGAIEDTQLLQRMKNEEFADETTKQNKELEKLLARLHDESKINQVGFYDLHGLSEKLKIHVPNFKKFEELLAKNKFTFSRTNFSEHGIKSSAPHGKIIEFMKQT